MAEYLKVNQAAWDERAGPHAASPEYGLDRYVTDSDRLSDVVRFDLPRLGDIRGLRAVHLQCHLGTDTLSLARLGAAMTGLDFSAAALAHARDLAARTATEISYVESEEHDSVPWEALPGRMEQVAGGEWRLADRPWRLPHSYTLRATRV